MSTEIDSSILASFNLSELDQVQKIGKLADCALSIPQRLMDKGFEKLIDIVESNPSLDSLVNNVTSLGTQFVTLKKIVDTIQTTKPETLLDKLAAAQGLSGAALTSKLNEITNTFSSVTGLDSILNGLNNLDICNTQNYTASGVPIQQPTLTPTSQRPPAIETITPCVNKYDPSVKDRYDQVMFHLKEFLQSDGISSSPAFARMLSIVNTLVHGYHDDIAKTSSNEKDTFYYDKYASNVEREQSSNTQFWDSELAADFKRRCYSAGQIIRGNANEIRAFLSRNDATSGEWMPWNMSVYGHVIGDDGKPLDKTTANDISTGKIPTSGQYTGTRDNALIPRVSVASNYFTFGTKLEVRTRDGQNLGVLSVDDSGGMSDNVIDYFVGGDRTLYDQLSKKSIRNGDTKPAFTIPVEIRVVSGGPKSSKKTLA